MNAALLTEPVPAQSHLAARARAALDYFGREHRPWFLAGSQQWMGYGAPKTLSYLGLTKVFTVVGMVAERLASPARPLPKVETRRIDDERGRRALADLNAATYGDLVHVDAGGRGRRVAVASTVIRVRRVYGSPARVDGLRRAAS
jgi:predicted small integral membrane protein